MKYQIVGTGNIAWFLVRRLAQSGHKCMRVYGRTLSKAKNLAKAAGAIATDKLTDITDDTDCCIIAISDNAVEGIATQLSFSQTVLIHTAGSIDRAVLSKSSLHNGVLWPIYSINKNSLPKHKNVPCVIEVSDNISAKALSILANNISNKIYSVNSEQRSWLHLCAVLSNNFVNHLFTISEDISKKQNLPFELLLPIITQTIKRIHNQSPKVSQTGPAIRKDNTTINKHLEMLQEKPDWQEVYKSITTSIDNTYNSDKEDKS